jgi:hypothetical protein
VGHLSKHTRTQDVELLFGKYGRWGNWISTVTFCAQLLLNLYDLHTSATVAENNALLRCK